MNISISQLSLSWELDIYEINEVIIGVDSHKQLEENYETMKINKKEWNLAIRTLIYNKSSSLLVVQDFESILQNLKTNIFAKFLKALNIGSDSNVLVVYDSKDSQLDLVCRNISNLELVNFTELTPRSLLKANSIICDVATLQKIEDTYAG